MKKIKHLLFMLILLGAGLVHSHAQTITISPTAAITIDTDLPDSQTDLNDPLGISATYTSPAIFTDGHKWLYMSINSDQPAAAGGVIVEQSNDDNCKTSVSANWDVPSVFEYDSANPEHGGYAALLTSRCVRVRYTNGTTAQTRFRLHALLVSGG